MVKGLMENLVDTLEENEIYLVIRSVFFIFARKIKRERIVV